MRQSRSRYVAGLRKSAVVVIAVGATMTAAISPAVAAPQQGVQVLASGLNAPFGLGYGDRTLYVAENAAGQIQSVNPTTGAQQVVVTGLISPAAVDRVSGNKLAIVTSGPNVPDMPTEGTASVFLASPGGKPKLLANLLEYELKNNPDGQLQFDPETHAQIDSLSNPFSLLAQRPGGPGLVFVADGGGNVVYSVARTGKVTPFFVPPVINTGACEGRPNNDAAHTGCDPVPTGLAYGPHNTLYVSTLSGEAPGEGRVYILNAKTGAVLDVISGLDSPTGVAVSPNGTVYVSEVLFGAPEGEGPPPPDFNPANVGRIVRIDKSGAIAYAAVTMPVGLVYEGGKLYSTAWAIAGFLGIPNAGQVVRVEPSAFMSADG